MGVVGISVCLVGWFIWTSTLGAGYVKFCDYALCTVLMGEYVCKTLLPSLVLEKHCLHNVGGCSSYRVRGISV